MQLATSDRTVRRYLATGQLAGTRTADGWTVSSDNVDRFLATRTVSPSTNGHVVADMAGSMTELVHLVDRLQRENRDLAGLVGALQERVGTLQAALEAPKEPTAQERPISSDSDAVTAETTGEPSKVKRAWWRIW